MQLQIYYAKCRKNGCKDLVRMYTSGFYTLMICLPGNNTFSQCVGIAAAWNMDLEIFQHRQGVEIRLENLAHGINKSIKPTIA